MGGALQAIARSSPARGARMERRAGIVEGKWGGQQKGAERGVKNVLGEGLGDRVTVPTHEAAKADVRESVWVSLDGRH